MEKKRTTNVQQSRVWLLPLPRIVCTVMDRLDYGSLLVALFVLLRSEETEASKTSINGLHNFTRWFTISFPLPIGLPFRSTEGRCLVASHNVILCVHPSHSTRYHLMYILVAARRRERTTGITTK